MDYFQNKKNVNDYLQMADGYDGMEIIQHLKNYLVPGSTILELGMGPGKDLDILRKNYVVTGSDNSPIFLDMYRKNNPDADLLLLDAEIIQTDRKFNCIYSNKVLHHLTREQLKNSFKNQWAALNPGGILCHSFWYGDTEFTHKGVYIVYYTPESIMDYYTQNFDSLEQIRYKELEENDSFVLILKKKSK
jgi:SAM-dependent methyltransferase